MTMSPMPAALDMNGGDPASVVVCHQIGLDYVSCSPFRVETARLAAGQAAVGESESASK